MSSSGRLRNFWKGFDRSYADGLTGSFYMTPASRMSPQMAPIERAKTASSIQTSLSAISAGTGESLRPPPECDLLEGLTNQMPVHRFADIQLLTFLFAFLPVP